MTDPNQEPAAAAESGPVAPENPAVVRDRDGGLRWAQVAIGLAGALLLVAVLVGTAPFWAPALPWGAAPARNNAAPVVRTDRPPATQPQSDQRRQEAETAASAAIGRLDRRLGALEAKPAVSASDIADIRQQMTRLSSTAADLAAQVGAIDKEVRSQASRAAADTALVVTLLQIRDAVAAGRPFAAVYEAFARLASAHPEIATAAAPLAGPAKTGVASHAVLAQRLRGMAGAIVSAKQPAAPRANASGGATDWADEALSRLRGLVTVRRIDDAAAGAGPEAVVAAAERALAGGDLDGAVARLDGLSGAPAEAARPWLRMAKERLAVEAALNRIEAVLATRLGAPPSAPADSGSAR